MIAISIESITIYHLRMTLKTTFKTSFGDETHRHPIIVAIKSDDYVGYGEAPGNSAPKYSYEAYKTILWVLKDFLVPAVLKKKTFKTPFEFHKTLQIIRGHPFAKTALEYAFWDLYAKILNKPLYQIYGGKKTRIPVGVSIGIMPIPKLLNSIEEYLSQGYKRIKIKIKPGHDIETLKKIREVFPEIPLQVDANAAYNLSAHLRLLKSLDNYNLLMLEQPLSYDDLVDHAYLRKLLRTPICLDESISSVNMARAGIMLRSMDIVNIKPPRVGGIINTLRIYNLLAINNIGMWIGGLLETGIGKSHLLHLASLPLIRYPSDISASSRYWDKDIVEKPLEISRDGTIKIPNGPGIGLEIDFDTLYKFTKNQWTFKGV